MGRPIVFGGLKESNYYKQREKIPVTVRVHTPPICKSRATCQFLERIFPAASGVVFRVRNYESKSTRIPVRNLSARVGQQKSGTKTRPMFDGQKSRHERDSNSGAVIWGR